MPETWRERALAAFFLAVAVAVVVVLGERVP